MKTTQTGTELKLTQLAADALIRHNHPRHIIKLFAIIKSRKKTDILTAYMEKAKKNLMIQLMASTNVWIFLLVSCQANQ